VYDATIWPIDRNLEERVFRQIFAAVHHSVGILIVEGAHA